MDFNLFREIIDEATKYGKRSFSLHLFGEPLLYPRIHDSIEYIKRRNKRHTILLTTNGTKLNELFDSVRSVDQIFWTWRKEAKFSDTTLTKLKKWGKFRVRIINEITPKEELKKWEKWPNIEFRQIHNYGGAIDIKKFGAENKTDSRWPCYHLWLAPAISWNGNFLMCCALPHQEEIIGKFKNQNIAEMWQGNQIKKIRESHIKGEFLGACKNCDVWKSYPRIF